MGETHSVIHQNKDSIKNPTQPTPHDDNKKLKTKKKTRKSKEMNRGGSIQTQNSVGTPNGDKMKAATKSSDPGLHI